MKSIRLFVPFLLIPLLASASDATIALASDGYPAGQGTPEGAACDLIRAFIQSDAELLATTCIKRYPPQEQRYDEFLAMIVRGTEEDKQRKQPHPRNPASVEKVFAARHLSASGPASYGHAVLNLQDVMFVDILTKLHDKSLFVNRTLVIKTSNGNWRVHPCPAIDALLSAGLNEESKSTIEFQVRTKKAGEVEPRTTSNAGSP